MLKRIVVGFLVYFAHVFAVKKLNDTGVTDLATIVKPEFKFKKPMLTTKELYKTILNKIVLLNKNNAKLIENLNK